MVEKRTREEFIFKAIEKHGDKYNYDDVIYNGSIVKVKINCKLHGIFLQSPNSHLVGHGCPGCSSIKSNTSSFIERAVATHNNYYNYSFVEYKNNKTKIKIICPKHGEFFQSPINHINGQGCKKCGFRTLTREEFIERANKIHFTTYDYSKLIYNVNEKLEIICLKHGSFFQKPFTHLSNKGCPQCKESKGERKIRVYLESNGISFIREKKFDKCIYKKSLRFDFYLPDKNLCIEFDGKHHFKNWVVKNKIYVTLEEVKKKDQIKNAFCEDNNIKLIRIPYTKIKEIEEILNGYLK